MDSSMVFFMNVDLKTNQDVKLLCHSIGKLLI